KASRTSALSSTLASLNLQVRHPAAVKSPNTECPCSRSACKRSGVNACQSPGSRESANATLEDRNLPPTKYIPLPSTSTSMSTRTTLRFAVDEVGRTKAPFIQQATLITRRKQLAQIAPPKPR